MGAWNSELDNTAIYYDIVTLNLFQGPFLLSTLWPAGHDGC
jgi:hypothetical protein